MRAMFTMMNNARLNVGLQGVSVAERATQAAVAYARERVQSARAGGAGKEPVAIIDHPDVRRMLLRMKALTQAARALTYYAAGLTDRATLGDADARARVDLLTPLVKAYGTDVGVEVASLGVQVHGGMGFVEETGAAQHLRDSRINPIYEGTNGIQAIDLVTRKLPLSGGETMRRQIAGMRATLQRLVKEGTPGFGLTGARLRDTVESLDRATSFMLKAVSGNQPEAALAGATPYLRLFGLAQGGISLAEAALAASAASRNPDPVHAARIALCRFFAENIATGASGLEQTVISGAGFLDDAPLALS